jgi:hypothetical protein
MKLGPVAAAAEHADASTRLGTVPLVEHVVALKGDTLAEAGVQEATKLVIVVGEQMMLR